MKKILQLLCVVLLIPLLSSGGAAYAQSRISGNQILQKQVTVSFADTPVKDVFASLQQETGVRIVYKATDIERLKPFSGKFSNASVASILDKCLAGRILYRYCRCLHLAVVCIRRG